MKLKVKDLLVDKERIESVNGRIEKLPEYRKTDCPEAYHIVYSSDLESVCAELEGYIELLNKLIEAAEVNLGG